MAQQPGSRLPAWAGAARAVAPWRWRLWFAVVIAEAVWTAGGSAVDVTMFSTRGADILHGNLGAVYADNQNQAGPVQLLLSWLFSRGSSDGTPLWTVAAVNAGLLSLALLACRGRWAAGPRSAGREAVVGALVAVWLLPEGLWGGHPAEIAIPILWVVAAGLARRGHGLSAGVSIGLACAVAPWGILALPVALLSPSRRTAMMAGLAGMLVGAGVYLPFVITGHFLLFHHRWPVYSGTLIHTLVPGLEYFGWDLRAAQAALAMGACAFVALRRRDTDGIWLAALAPALVRVVTDPVVGIYYWQPIGAAVIVGIALGAPIVASRPTWVALGLLAYLPYLANISGMWLIVGGVCLAATGVLTMNSPTGPAAKVVPVPVPGPTPRRPVGPALVSAAAASYAPGMSNAWGGPPGRAGWYAQQNPGGQTPDPDEEQHAAGQEWAQTHPNVFRRLLARLHRA